MPVCPTPAVAVAAVLAAAVPASLLESGVAHAQTSGCPGLKAHIVVRDYDGPLVIDLCVEPQGFSLTGDTVNLRGNDPYIDGLFHSEFELRP
jgi:hypothetical protein